MAVYLLSSSDIITFMSSLEVNPKVNFHLNKSSRATQIEIYVHPKKQIFYGFLALKKLLHSLLEPKNFL